MPNDDLSIARPDDLARRLAGLTPAQRALLEQKLKRSTAPREPGIPKRSSEALAPLSFAQQRLWFLDRYESDSSLYNIPLALKLEGELDVPALRSALSEIVRRHETLRTTFSINDGEPLQIIHPASEIELPIRDLGGLAPDERHAEFLKLKGEAARRPFDLAAGPLMRPTLVRLADSEHVLLVTFHHIVCDGWSIGIFRRELDTLYRGAGPHLHPHPPELPIQYADYAVWQRQWLQGEVLDKQTAYWKKQLAAAPPLLELPADRPRPALQTFRGAHCALTLPPSLCAALHALSRREHATLFMTLLAAFSALLARYCRSDDIVIGSPVAGRARPETENLIGLFVNTLALRADLSGDPSFRELLQRVREVCLSAYAHQDLPFEKLVEELKPARSLSYSPLVQVLFVLQNVPHSTAKLSKLSASALTSSTGTAKFDLSLYVTEIEDRIRVAAEFNTGLFNASTIARLLGHYEVLLAGAIADPQRRIGALPLLTEPERKALLFDRNQTAVSYPQAYGLHQLFEAQVLKTPDAVALVFEDKHFRYRELNARANQVAHHLINLGIGAGVLVGVCVERSLEMIAGLLGILKAGGAYVPLDPNYPDERLAFMLGDAALSVVVTEQGLVPRLRAQRATLVFLDDDAIAAQPEHDLIARGDADALAYVIYTSGSTGKPKGVCVSHGALANLLYAMRDHTAISGEDSWLAVTTLSFDIAALELYLPLITGARLVLASRDVAIDGEALARCLADRRITLMQATPATWRLLIEAGWQGSDTLHVLCGGEALTPELADPLLARCASLTNLYGPTETTIWSSACRVKASEPITIGRPLANTAMYILDGALNPTPAGVPGELHIGGAGLARGYLNRQELTAEKFIRNPFSDDPGSRLYKTGDLARYREDGDIEFLGRLDHQVKLRGYRIELGEIEACLVQHPKVVQAVVVVREDHGGDKRLTAYIVFQNASSIANGDELRSFLKEKLPYYMLPSAFVALGEFPLTPNGKLDRKALPAPDRSQTGAAPVAPRTPLEEQLAAVFARVLDLDRVGVHDNFFDLGGHSFLVLRVLAEIEKACGRRLSVATLFQAPTVEEIAHILNAGDSIDESDVIVPLNPHGATAPLFSVWMGIATQLRDLGRCLGPEQRFYGINSHWDPTRMRMTSIEEMAAYNLTHLRKVQPHGPYYLSSDCVATLIVFEIAQQLVAEGEEVAALILIDPLPPRTLAKPTTTRGRTLGRVRRYWRRLGDANLIEKFVSLSWHALTTLGSRIWGRIALPVCLALRLPLSRGLMSRYIFDAHQHARNQYAPKPYGGKIWFIWAADELNEARRGEIQHAWSKLAAHAAHRKVPGTHAELFKDPYVGPLAGQMRMCLAEARAASHESPEQRHAHGLVKTG